MKTQIPGKENQRSFEVRFMCVIPEPLDLNDILNGFRNWRGSQGLGKK